MGEPTMFRVLLTLQIKPGLSEDFEKTWYGIGDVVTSHPANRGQWLMRSGENPDVYYITSDWVDEPSFREFEHSADHVEHRVKLHPFRSDGSMATMHQVFHLPHAGASA